MFKQLLIIVTIMTLVLVIAMLNTGGFISTFLIAFGLISLFAFIVMVMMAKKNKQK